MNYEILNMICFSTAHIQEEDTIKLTKEIAFSPAIRSEGFMFYAGHSMDMYIGYSQAFQYLILIAQALKCEFIQLDRDGPIYQSLPKFKW